MRVGLGKWEDFVYGLKEVVQVLKPYKSIIKPSDFKETKVSSPCSAIFEAADQHVGEIVDETMVDRFGIYNWNITQQYANDIMLAYIKWIDMARSSYNIPICRYLQMGDPISGDIHEELKVTNEWPTPEQTVRSAILNANMIRFLARSFQTIQVDWLCTDNHSRLTKKPQKKQSGLNSYSYLAAQLCKYMLAQVDNVEFRIHLAIEVRINVSNTIYLITHGHQIKGGFAGIPYYGIDRLVSREAKRRMTTNKWFHKLKIAHFHTPVDSFYWSVAGSMAGTNEYDHSQGRFAPPSQVGAIVHPKRGEFNRTAFVPKVAYADEFESVGVLDRRAESEK